MEFNSGNQHLVGHPEAVRFESKFYVLRDPDGGYAAFTAESVSRLLDLPIAPSK
jgi:hypothetical protein